MGAKVSVERLRGRTTMTLHTNGRERRAEARSGEAVTLTPHYERRDPDGDGPAEANTVWFIDLDE